MPELLGNTVEEKSRGRSWCPTGTSVTGAGTCLGTCPGVLVPALWVGSGTIACLSQVVFPGDAPLEAHPSWSPHQ